MGITLRNTTGSALTYNQMDENFRFLSQSYFYLSGSNTVSGSLTLTGSLNVSGSITGSLLGTASNALSASYSNTLLASAINASPGEIRFRNSANTTISSISNLTASLAITASSVTPLSQSVVITGSLIVSNSIDSNSNILLSDNGQKSIHWDERNLYDNGEVVAADWRNRILKDGTESESVNWESRVLLDSSGSSVLEWSLLDTATFYGTSSIAVSALTASTALTASSVTPLNQNVIITGSLLASGSTSFTGTHTLSGSNTITGNTTLSGSINVSGSSNFHNTLFIVTGSQFYSGSSVYVGNQTITGSLNLTNGESSGFYINGQKQFNYISAYHTASILPTQNVSGSFIYNTVTTSSGITITNNSRITFANTGIYNIQFSAQMYAPTNNTNVFIWFKRNGTNIANSATQVDIGSSDYGVVAWNYVDTFTSGSYAEIFYQTDQTTTQFQYIAATGNIPAIPSIRVSVTQVA
jgi:cytoskeletal protein CcmA (bactofilin family)